MSDAIRGAAAGTPSGRFPTAGLFLFLALILLLRCLAAVLMAERSQGAGWVGWVMAPDSRDYVYFADDMSDGTLDSASFRTPLYPLLVALTQGLLDVRWLGTVLAQQLAVALTALACGIVAGRRCGPKAGWLAAAVYSICPLALIESFAILPDVVLAMAVAWAGVLWLGSLVPGRPPRLAGTAAGGLLLGAATLVKPSVFLLFLVPLVHVSASRSTPVGRKLLTGAVLVACATLLPLAWRIDNLVRFGSPFLTTQDSFEIAGRFRVLSGQETQESFWLSYVDSVEQQVIQGPIVYEDLACTKVPEGWAGLGGGRFCPSMDIEARDSLFRSIALTSFRSAPLRIVIGHFLRWPWFLANPVGDLGRAGGPRIARAAIRAGSMALQVALALGALLALVRRRVRAAASDLLVFSALTFLVTAVVTGPLAGTRYSLPFYWALVSVACCGWAPLSQGTKPGNAGRRVRCGP